VTAKPATAQEEMNMATYMLFIREGEIVDAAAMARYQASNRSAPPNPDLKPLIVYGKQEALEGKAPDGMVLIEFPNAEAAKAWYYSDDYQAAIKDRQLAADYRCIMVEGFAA
jgi:uncharacterized protein (DUF1330 family)